MKKARKLMTAVVSVLCMTTLMYGSAMAAGVSNTYAAKVYDTDGEGLALKAGPDISSQRYMLIPEDTDLTIDGVTSTGWGYTTVNGYDGWISLRYTLAGSNCQAETPSYGAIDPIYYIVEGTQGDGLEFRTRPSVESSTFGPITDGSVVLVRAIQGDWAYVAHEAHSGWLNTAYITKWNFGTSYQVTVYDTDGEGLALKSEADINSSRIMLVPEGTSLTLDRITTSGWGHTTVDGNSGWVALRYTKVQGKAAADIPTTGFTKAKTYVVKNTEGEGLELRMRPSIESSTFGPVNDDARILVHAISGDWAYTCVNGNYGWCNLTYMKEAE